MDWESLRKNTEVRHKTITAIMPRSSSSIMTGLSPGIMPLINQINKPISNKRILELLEKK